jgi:hypothetical protein
MLATLLRLSFPSWAFFDRVGTPPRLELRRVDDDGRGDAWRPAIAVSGRRWWHVLWHPRGTRTLAAQVAVERWHATLDDGDAADRRERVRAHATAHALAAACAAAMPDATAGSTWRLRLVEGTDAGTRLLHDGRVTGRPS